MASGLRALGHALQLADAAYLRDELLERRGISARLRSDGELAQILVHEEHLEEARELRTLLLDEARSSGDERESRPVQSRPLIAGALVTMMSIVLAPRFGSNAALGVVTSVLLGASVFLLVRFRDV